MVGRKFRKDEGRGAPGKFSVAAGRGGTQGNATSTAAQANGSNNAAAHGFGASGGSGNSGNSGSGGQPPTPEPPAPAGDPELLEIGVWTFQTAGNGGTHNDVSYRDRVINTENYNGIAGASLASNAITLPAGTYEIEFMCQVAGTHQATVRLWNDTAAALIDYGVNDVPENTTSGNIISGFTRQVFAVETVISMDSLGNIAQTTNGFGISAGSGDDNVFALVMVRKVG